MVMHRRYPEEDLGVRPKIPKGGSRNELFGVLVALLIFAAIAIAFFVEAGR
jgi:hypothetical protein